MAWATRADSVLVVGLVALAAAVRLPDFLFRPTFTDENRGIIRAALTAAGKLHSFTDVDPYISSLFNYAVAGLLVGFGPRLELPRLLVLGLGCLTVAATYLLARDWGGRAAGLLAALLVLVNPVHVLINSHVAWSNSTTPLFTTLALWQLGRGVERRDGPALIAAGALFGLGLLTHPGVVVLLPGAAVYLLWRAPGLLRGRWPWLAAAAFLLVYSPLILFNLRSGFETLQAARHVQSVYTGGRSPGPIFYAEQLGGFTSMLVRTLGGAIAPAESSLAGLLQPAALGWLLFGPLACLALARRGRPLPLLVVALGLPVAALYGSDSFEPIFQGRYVVPIAIPVWAAAGVVAARLFAPERPGPRWGRPAAVGLALAALGLALAGLVGYQDDAPDLNRSLIEATAAIESAREPDETVLVDDALKDRQTGGGWRLARSLEMLLTIRGVPQRLTNIDPDTARTLLTRRSSQLVVLDSETVARLSKRYSLSPIAPIVTRSADPPTTWHGVYRLAPPR